MRLYLNRYAPRKRLLLRVEPPLDMTEPDGVRSGAQQNSRWGGRMEPSGLLRGSTIAALAACSIGAAVPTTAACEVRYSSSRATFAGCAAEERSCEAAGYIFGTTGFAQCVAALGQRVTRVPERRARGVRPGRRAGIQPTQPAPPLPVAPPRPQLAPPLPPVAPPVASPLPPAPNKWP